MIPSPETVVEVIRALNESGAPYILPGSLSRNLYATPRSTQDADFVVEMPPAELEKLFKRLSGFLRREPQMSFETVTGKPQHKFRHEPTKFIVEIFEARMDDPHERARFDRRKRGVVEGTPVLVPTAEDVIIQKLRWLKQIRRKKDREDVRDMLLHLRLDLDWPYLEHWTVKHGSASLLQEVRHEVKQLLQSQGSR